VAGGKRGRERLLANLLRRNIPGLDGLRGIAALTVVLFHGWSERFPGRLAVQVFFVISGLLITWLLLQERQRNGTIDRKAFYCRRAFRLFPALFALLAWEWLTDFPHASGIVAAALYFANYHVIIGGQLFGLAHTWSLAVEEHFYLIWPQVFLFVRNQRALLRGCFAVAAIEFVWRTLAANPGRFFYATLATETSSSAILFGCGLALLLWYFPRSLPAFAMRPIMAPISLAMLLALAQLPVIPQWIWGIPVGIPFAAIIVLQAIAYEWPILENRVARYLGRISYGVYLWCFVAKAIVERLGHGLEHTLLLPVVIALASMSYYLIERPIQSLGRRWLDSRNRRALIPAGAAA
jgi:peptidoglycan/LPS O-acetylase OafA/YrhL